ncbi:MAG TPA: hypothetical protein PLO89_08000, partial [Spirochaetota bacterium]|nr:hypothetical protein [Spirochaetota bacterium]
YILGAPKGDAGSYTFIGGSSLSIPSYKKDNINSVKLLKYITSSEKLNAYCSEVRFMPPDTTLWERWKDKENYNKLIELINTGKTFPNIPQWGIVGSKLVNCFGDVLELAGSSFFTYEKLYDILFKYNEELNDFFKVVKKVEISKDDFIRQIMDCKKKANINSYNNKGKKIIPVASLFFLFLFAVIIFLLFFRDKNFPIKIIGLRKSVVSSFIVFVVITQMLIIFVASYIIVQIFIERDFSEIISKNNNISKNISMYIDSKIEAYIGKLDILSNTDSFTRLDKEGMKKVLASQFFSQIFISGEKLFVVDEKNRVICDNSITMPFDFEKSITDFNISMVLPPKPYVSEIFQDNLSPKINIAVGITIHNKGAIVGEFSLNRITDFIRQQKINNNSFIILTDSKGDIIDYYGLKIEKKLANIADMGFKSGSAEYFKKNKIRKIKIPKNGIFSVSREFTNDDKIGVFVFERSGNLSIIAGENFIFIVFIFLMILFETLIISAYIYRALIKPINRLSKILKKKDNDRILTKESDIRFLNMNNEIGSLFSGYDYLIKDINLKNNELISLNNNLNDLVIERTKDLEEANVKLKRLDNLKNDFIANITHDFRS